jgi:hypothetical protein
MSDTLVADGTVLSWAPAGSTDDTAFNDILNAVSVDPPDISADMIDAPKLATKFKKKRSGKPGGNDGTIVLEFQHDDDFLIQVKTWASAGPFPEILLRLTLENGARVTWPSIPSGWKGPTNMEEEGRLEAEIPYTTNGIPVIDPPPVIP